MSVRQSVRKEQLVSSWTNFGGILYWNLLPKFVEKIEVALIPDTLNGYTTLIPTQIDGCFICLGTLLAVAPTVANDFLDTVFTPVTTVPMATNATMVPMVTVLTRTHILFRSSLRCSEGVIVISNV